jgi:hypothetical protein
MNRKHINIHLCFKHTILCKRLFRRDYSYKERQVVTIWVQSEANTASVPCQLQSRRFNHSINMQCFDSLVRQSVGQLSQSFRHSQLQSIAINPSINQSVNIAKSTRKKHRSQMHSNGLCRTLTTVCADIRFMSYLQEEIIYSSVVTILRQMSVLKNNATYSKQAFIQITMRLSSSSLLLRLCHRAYSTTPERPLPMTAAGRERALRLCVAMRNGSIGLNLCRSWGRRR